MNVLIHAVGVANFGYALYYDFVFVHVPSHLRGKQQFQSLAAFPGKWKYLTIWNMVLQFVYHSIALINDVAGSSELNARRQSVLQKFRDNLFASWAFPIGVFVSLSFWGLFALDREVVFPKVMDEFYPTWLNHCVHTAPIAILLLETLVVPKIFPSRLNACVANVVFTGSYIGWIIWVYNHNNVWAYPLLDMLNNYQRAAFILACGIAILLCCFIGDILNSLKWGKASMEGKASSGKGGKAGKGKRKTK